MNWRTDKPTADVIVANHTDSDIYDILRRIDGKYYLYTMFGAKEIPIDEIKKWADLEENETVTDCNELEEEIEMEWDSFNKHLAKYDEESEDVVWLNWHSFKEIARHFAKLDANHIADESKKV